MKKFLLSLAVTTVGITALAETPAELYLIGGPAQWKGYTEEEFRLEENDGIFTGTFEFPDYSRYFYFATEQSPSQEADWTFIDNHKYGPIGDGAEIKSGETCNIEINGTGAWCLEYAGTWKLTVNSHDLTLTAECISTAPVDDPIVSDDIIYLIGQPEGWDITYSDMYLTKTGDGIYEGAFDIEAGNAMFRFYTALGDWENNSLGYQVSDIPTDFTFEEGKCVATCIKGKGSYNFPTWNGGTMGIILNTNKNEVTFYDGITGMTLVPEAGETVYYDLQGRKVTNPDNGLYIHKNGRTTEKVMVK